MGVRNQFLRMDSLLVLRQLNPLQHPNTDIQRIPPTIKVKDIEKNGYVMDCTEKNKYSFTFKHHQHMGEGIRAGAYQKWTLLQQVLLITRRIFHGNPNHRCVKENQRFCP